MLNANHKSGLRSTFLTIDDSLVRAMTLLDSSREQSPFSEQVHDATPAQHRVVSDYVSRIRQAMRQALESFGIPPPQPRRSSVWAARMAVLSATVTVEEARPKHLRGYGVLSKEDGHAVEKQLAPIHDLLQQLQEYLAGESIGEEKSPAANDR